MAHEAGDAGTAPQSAGSYAWNADDYARHSAGQYIWARELLDKLVLAPHERVLDIGCGDGKVTAALAGSVPQGRAVGVDNSLDMIRLANATYSPALHPNLRFSLMDATRLSFDGQFDAAFSNAVLHWVHDHPAVLRGVANALAPGGRLLFQMGGRGNAADIVALLDDILVRQPWQPYFAGFSLPYAFFGPEEYAEWLPQAGLLPVRMELLVRDMRHVGREGFAGWFRTTWHPYTHCLPEALQPAFVDEVVDSYLSRFPVDDEGQVHVRMVRLEVEAVKPA